MKAYEEFTGIIRVRKKGLRSWEWKIGATLKGKASSRKKAVLAAREELNELLGDDYGWETPGKYEYTDDYSWYGYLL